MDILAHALWVGAGVASSAPRPGTMLPTPLRPSQRASLWFAKSIVEPEIKFANTALQDRQCCDEATAGVHHFSRGALLAFSEQSKVRTSKSIKLPMSSRVTSAAG